MIFIYFMWTIVIVIAVLGVTQIVAWNKTGAKEAKKLAADRGVELRKAQRTLRIIANGSTDPQLVAEIYLDTYESKEIDV